MSLKSNPPDISCFCNLITYLFCNLNQRVTFLYPNPATCSPLLPKSDYFWYLSTFTRLLFCMSDFHCHWSTFFNTISLILLIVITLILITGARSVLTVWCVCWWAGRAGVQQRGAVQRRERSQRCWGGTAACSAHCGGFNALNLQINWQSPKRSRWEGRTADSLCC